MARNCVDVVDGKHIVIQAPANCGATFYNYKNTNSIGQNINASTQMWAPIEEYLMEEPGTSVA